MAWHQNNKEYTGILSMQFKEDIFICNVWQEARKADSE